MQSGSSLGTLKPALLLVGVYPPWGAGLCLSESVGVPSTIPMGSCMLLQTPAGDYLL
jgi:hypothetical protein